MAYHCSPVTNLVGFRSGMAKQRRMRSHKSEGALDAGRHDKPWAAPAVMGRNRPAKDIARCLARTMVSLGAGRGTGVLSPGVLVGGATGQPQQTSQPGCAEFSSEFVFH